MFSMWEKVSGAIMFVRDHGREILLSAQAEKQKFSPQRRFGTQERWNRPSA
jgi:hypothetical protein